MRGPSFIRFISPTPLTEEEAEKAQEKLGYPAAGYSFYGHYITKKGKTIWYCFERCE